MDSLSQLALGAACGIAVMGRRTAVWKAALWGGVAGTLPDLDALWDFGDAVSNMTYHRGLSHGLLILLLIAPLLAWLPAKLHRQMPLYRRWWAAMALALFTHPLLDAMTIYGTQLLQPLSDHPFAVGSLFIIDPLYTLPLVIGVVVALSMRQFAGLRCNTWGLVLSSVYVIWSVVAQQHVASVVRAQLQQQGQPAARFLVTPTPLNTVAWRVVVMQKGAGQHSYQEGFYSLLDQDRHIVFDTFASDASLQAPLANNAAAQRMMWFTHGFYSLQQVGDQAVLTDLRMGQEPHYVFSFALASKNNTNWIPIHPQQVGDRGDASALLPWLWHRIQGHNVPPPRS